ncbi:ribonuclease H-like domain-containing protein [Tanacetum coccineum]
MHDPREPHLSALKRILRYVQGILNYGLQLFSSCTTDLVAYSDAEWAGCPTTRRSTLGYCVFLGNSLLSWSAKRQPTLSRSSAEAEYRGVANAVAETCWLGNLLRELHTPLSSATLVYCDNVSVVYLSSNLIQRQRTKHIEIDIHFVRDLVAAGQVRVLHVPSCYQFADIFTKGLPSALFEEFRSSLSIRSPPALTAGGGGGGLKDPYNHKIAVLRSSATHIVDDPEGSRTYLFLFNLLAVLQINKKCSFRNITPPPPLLYHHHFSLNICSSSSLDTCASAADETLTFQSLFVFIGPDLKNKG